MSRGEFEREVEELGEGQGVARRLMALKLGSGSRVRLSLRARLLSEGRPRPAYAGRRLAAGAIAALAAWLLVTPRPAPRPRPAVAEAPPRVSAPPPAQKLLFRSVRPVGGASVFQTVSAGRPIRTRPIRIEQLFVRPALAGS